jgi:hypothetical protein
MFTLQLSKLKLTRAERHLSLGEVARGDRLARQAPGHNRVSLHGHEATSPSLLFVMLPKVQNVSLFQAVFADDTQHHCLLVPEPAVQASVGLERNGHA